MYSYTYDEETGGIILNPTPTTFSKEPRPVYAPELDLLGFNKYWNYDKQDEVPYMWAEKVRYFYRGRFVGKLKGGKLYDAPEVIIARDANGNPISPEPNGGKLKPIDIEGMTAKNKTLLDALEAETIKGIQSEYEKYKDKLDIFHVAFSGGKDSTVLLEVVKRALPAKSFVVIFGDTGMEFPDTYKTVEHTRKACEEQGIPFYIAHSPIDAHDTWKLFGSPARVLRWCCSVHKSSPQTLKLRELTGKNDYVGMDFVGVRKWKSPSRRNYTYESYGAKSKGQYSYNAILDWTAAEIWLYTFARGLYINEAYKKGNSRAGCLFCPMAGGLSNYIRRSNYPEETDRYIQIVKDMYFDDDEEEKMSYLVNGGWNARNNGRDLKNNPLKYIEEEDEKNLILHIIKPSSDWQEWIKTLGDLSEVRKGHYSLMYEGQPIDFYVQDTDNGYKVKIAKSYFKHNIIFRKYLRRVFHKAAYCIGCRICEANCPYGCIKFVGDKVSISDCTHCHQCLNIYGGCFRYHCLKYPLGAEKNKHKQNKNLT